MITLSHTRFFIVHCAVAGAILFGGAANIALACDSEEECTEIYLKYHGINWINATAEEVYRWIDDGGDLAARDSGENTPLGVAVGHIEEDVVIAALIKAGGDVNARNQFEATPAHYAAWKNENPAVLETLLQAGAEVNAQDKDNRTPLHWTTGWRENPLAMTEALLQAGAEANGRDRDGLTPLHFAAASNQDSAVIAVLVAYGANLDHENAAGETPLDVAQKENHAEMVAYLSNPAQVKKDAENYRLGLATE